MKAYQPSSNCRFTTLPSVNDPNNIPSPYADPFTVAPEYDNGACVTQNQFEFHTEWSDGHVHAGGVHDGLAAEQGDPRPRSIYPGMDLDLNGMNEENGGPTFAAITSRSYHPGGVNALLGDGSVRFVKSTIDGMSGAPSAPSPAARSSRAMPTELEAWRWFDAVALVIADHPAGTARCRSSADSQAPR